MTHTATTADAHAMADTERIDRYRFAHKSGERLLGRFVVQRGLGIGGFGEVYFAISDAGKEVALKEIQRNLEIELRGVSHCLNLKHPNLVSIHDLCQDDAGRWWIVMEYVAGANLRDHLDDHPNGLALDEARRWFQGMAAGVDHLHQEGLVHRDLKPGNIFDDRGVVKVGDYGLSKFISETRRGGHTESVGTFHYMAPEVGRGEYGREIDIYALGVILYELVTGQLPFDGESSHEIIMKHLTATPDLSRLTDPWRMVVAKALAKDPKLRWRSAGEMARMLDAAAGLQTNANGSAPTVKPLESDWVTATWVPPTNPSAATVTSGGTPAPANHGSPSSPVATPVASAALPNATLASRSDSLPSSGPSEPVAKAITHTVQDFRSWWRGAGLSPTQRRLLIAVAIVAVWMNTRWLLPVLSLLAIVYVPYYILRQIMIGDSPAMSYEEAHRLAVAGQSRPKPLSKSKWKQLKRVELASKRASVQLAELAGSWTAASVASVICGLAFWLIVMRDQALHALAIAPYVWIGSVTMLVSLAILAFGKLWEGHDGDPLRRRMVMLGVGGGIGAMAYGTAQFLKLDLSAGLSRSFGNGYLPASLYDVNHLPSVGAYMLHFALMMAIVRWWKVSDPLRSTRFGIWPIIAIALLEWFIHQFVPINQPYGILVATGAAIATQIGAPWENPLQREFYSTGSANRLPQSHPVPPNSMRQVL